MEAGSSTFTCPTSGPGSLQTQCPKDSSWQAFRATGVALNLHCFTGMLLSQMLDPGVIFIEAGTAICEINENFRIGSGPMVLHEDGRICAVLCNPRKLIEQHSYASSPFPIGQLVQNTCRAFLVAHEQGERPERDGWVTLSVEGETVAWVPVDPSLHSWLDGWWQGQMRCPPLSCATIR